MSEAPLHFKTISELAALIKSKTLSPVEVTEAMLNRIQGQHPLHQGPHAQLGGDGQQFDQEEHDSSHVDVATADLPADTWWVSATSAQKSSFCRTAGVVHRSGMVIPIW